MPSASNLLLALMVAVLGISTAHAEESGPVARAKERAQDEFNTGLEVLHGMYRRRMAQLITSATRVEVLLLDFSFGEEKRAKPALQVFEIKPYSKNTPVLASHFCTPKEREELLPVLSNAIGGQPHIGGAACHFPIHGLRVWIGPEIAFETSICWYCSNFIMEYGRGAAWENHTDGFRDLKTLLMRLMPIPEDEVARFKKGHDAGPDGH